MKFDLLVSTILEETQKKLYKVTFLKYGIHGEYTRANSRDEAKENIARKHKKSVEEFKSINGAVAKLIEEGFEKEKSEGLHGWFSRRGAKGHKGWIDCKTGGTCGRKKGEKRKGYPACRPTKSMCSASKRKKKSHKRISWKKK
jgi:hypothetical protein